MTDREAMEQAQERLELWFDERGLLEDAEAIAALRERLAQPAPTIDKLGCVPAGDTSQERVDEPEKQRHEQKPPVKTYCGGKPNYCTSEVEEHMKEDIIKMAREAELETYLAPHWDLYEELERFAALVAAAEREACAKVCDEQGAGRKALEHYAALTYSGASHDCAAAIRARGQA